MLFLIYNLSSSIPFGVTSTNTSYDPTTNVGIKNGSSVGICTHRIHLFLACLAPICTLSCCLVKQFLHRSSVGSLPRVHCWLGTSRRSSQYLDLDGNPENGAASSFLFCPCCNLLPPLFPPSFKSGRKGVVVGKRSGGRGHLEKWSCHGSEGTNARGSTSLPDQYWRPRATRLRYRCVRYFEIEKNIVAPVSIWPASILPCHGGGGGGGGRRTDA